MTDFLDRFGSELGAAERRLVTAGERHPLRRRRASRRGALVALAALAITVPALAATQPWEPILGEPGTANRPAGISPTPPAPNQLNGLAVLRRPQNESDRGPEAQKLMRQVGAEYKGVRLDSIRLLSSTSGHHALLVPSAEHGASSKPGQYEVKDDLCLETAQGGFCDTGEGLPTSNFLGGDGEAMYGLVPDGVAKVSLSFADGTTRSSEVRENFFWIEKTPRGPQTGLKVKWFDADGRQVGPRGRLAG
jgi:hypothetical protein